MLFSSSINRDFRGGRGDWFYKLATKMARVVVLLLVVVKVGLESSLFRWIIEICFC